MKLRNTTIIVIVIAMFATSVGVSSLSAQLFRGRFCNPCYQQPCYPTCFSTAYHGCYQQPCYPQDYFESCGFINDCFCNPTYRDGCTCTVAYTDPYWRITGNCADVNCFCPVPEFPNKRLSCVDKSAGGNDPTPRTFYIRLDSGTSYEERLFMWVSPTASNKSIKYKQASGNWIIEATFDSAYVDLPQTPVVMPIDPVVGSVTFHTHKAPSATYDFVMGVPVTINFGHWRLTVIRQ